ncbi:LuxR family transcriptional regulator [Streptomyces bambusae]|uniref:LuxR family transcriptional regulator n=1 Tax=Streptomyces bambusae TaxID=1550616 RepID=UPI001CFEDB47|nr:LuxR family transcriptional regulator [Streptomyces bambusae]MCB5166125.1 LuxR family transcriptional regulator [Streptomyces bambusae]
MTNIRGIPQMPQQWETSAADPQQALREAAWHLGELANRLTAGADSLARADKIPQPPCDDPGFSYVHGKPEILAAMQDHLDAAQTEILTAQPEGPRPGAVLQAALEAVRGRISAGVAMRTLYQHSTRFDEATKDYVRTATAYGAQIRTLDEFFDRLIIVDRRTAFLPANADRSIAAVVTEPAVVRFLTDTFERAWDRAAPHPFVPVRAAEAAADVVPAIREAIVKLLAEGRSDREIARRLGLSLRSLQSHVSHLKTEYGAEHRFQLGFLIGRESASPSR